MECAAFVDQPTTRSDAGEKEIFARMSDGRVFTQYHRPCVDVAFTEGEHVRLASTFESRKYLTQNATKLMWGMDGVPAPAGCAARVPEADAVQYCDAHTCSFQRPNANQPQRLGMRRADS